MFPNEIELFTFLNGDFPEDLFESECWKDDFIIELFRWYNNKYQKIDIRKGRGEYKEWKEYYEQMVRILYLAVIKYNIRDTNSLKNVFEYFFEVEDDDPYRYDPDMISAEKLLNVYNYIVKKIGNKKYEKEEEDKKYDNLYPFVGRWNNDIMTDLYAHLDIRTENGKIVGSIPRLGEEEEEPIAEEPEQLQGGLKLEELLNKIINNKKIKELNKIINDNNISEITIEVKTKIVISTSSNN